MGNGTITGGKRQRSPSWRCSLPDSSYSPRFMFLLISAIPQIDSSSRWSDDALEEVARLGEGAGGAVHTVRDKRTGEIMARKENKASKQEPPRPQQPQPPLHLHCPPHKPPLLTQLQSRTLHPSLHNHHPYPHTFFIKHTHHPTHLLLIP